MFYFGQTTKCILIVGSIFLLITSCGRVVKKDSTAPTFSFTPFAISSEVYYQGGWSPTHNGIDIGANQNASFQAVASGIFHKYKYQNEKTSRWQVNVYIDFNATYQIDYSFEPFGTANDPVPANNQYDYLIADNTFVSSGESLGQLYFAGSGAHVHFGVTPASDPMNYFLGSASIEMHAFVGE